MSAIIIPSINIYGEPKSSTNNNIINSVEFEEEQIYKKTNEFFNISASINGQDSIYSSNYKNTFNENVEIVNYEKKTFGTELDHWFDVFKYFELSINLDKKTIYEDIDLGISTNYKSKNWDVIEQPSKDIIENNYLNETYSEIPELKSYIGDVEDFESFVELTSDIVTYPSVCTLAFKTNTKKSNSVTVFLRLYSAKTKGTYKERIFFNYNISLQGKVLDISTKNNYIGNEDKYKIETNELMSNTTNYFQDYSEKVKLVVIDDKNIYFELKDGKPNTIGDINCVGKWGIVPDIFSEIKIGETRSPTKSFSLPHTYEFIKAEIDKKQTELIANNIIENYSKGKKSIKMKVGYADYYYEDGTAYGGINGKKQILQFGEIVKPMKYKNGKDIPMSIKKDGSARIFEITSSEVSTKGAPYVNLQLIEKTT